jgi:hypothetical protein
MKMKVAALSGILVFITQAGLHADAPGWFRDPTYEYRLKADTTLPGDALYALPPFKVVVDPAHSTTGGASLTFSFEPAGGVTGTTFEVRAGGKLHFKGCQLIESAIICHPGGEVRLEDCTLIEAYLSNGGKTTPAGSTPPKVSLTGCQLTDVTIESPTATGVVVNDSNLFRCRIEAGQADGMSTTSSYSQSFFKDCLLKAPEALMACSGCTFLDCHYTGVFDETMGSYLPAPLLLKLSWKGGTPSELPAKAGKVHFEILPFNDEVQRRRYGMWKHVKMPWRPSKSLSLDKVAEFIPGGVLPAASPPPPPRVASAPMPGASSLGSTPTITNRTPFKSRITAVNGLLISQLSSGETAGQVTKMSLTALPSLDNAPSTLKFNQSVGSDMAKALNEVSKFAQLRHNGLPAGHAIELGFADKYIDKDGPSAAVACALLLEAAITGKEWDPAFAVTGDMNADGSVQPIGGVQAKVRGATKGGCKIVGIPSKNEKAISDILVLEGPAPLVQIGVFSISKFDEALALADPKRADALARALAELENVRNVLSRMSSPQVLGTLRTQQAQSRLQYILQAAPNCLSAKYLLLFAQGRGPRSLSIGGSIEAADSSAIGLIKSISNDVEKSVNTLKGDEVGTSINKLKNLRPKLDPRVWPYVDNVIAYGEVIRSSILNPVRSGARYADLVSKARQAAQAAKAAFEKITGDPQVREELGL